MPLSNDFKAKIKDGKIKEALEMALAEAVELKITTWVAQEGQENGSASAEVSPNQRLETRINLLSNEIATEVGQEFADGGVYSQLKVFHQEQVNQSHRLIQNNINCLQRLLSLWGRLDPAVAASIPAIDQTIAESRQPLLIGDDADFSSNVLPASTPIVASSVAETPLISVPQVESLAVEPKLAAESPAALDRESLLEDEYRGLETSKLWATPASEPVAESFAAETPVVGDPESDILESNSGMNLPGIAAAAGVGMLGMNLYHSFQDNRENDEPQSETPEVESFLNVEAETSVAEPVSNPVDLDPFADLSTPVVETTSEDPFFSPSSSEFNLSAETPALEAEIAPSTDNLVSSGWNNESWMQPEISSTGDFPEDNLAAAKWDEESLTPTSENRVDLSNFTTESPSTALEKLENPDSLSVSNWSEGTWNQADIPSLEDFSAEEMSTPSAELAANEDEGAFASSHFGDLGTVEIAPPTQENTNLLGWSEETFAQGDVPVANSFGVEEMSTPSAELVANEDEEAFASSHFGDLGAAEIAPLASETKDLGLSGWSNETLPQLDTFAPADFSAEETPMSVDESLGAFNSEDRLESADAIESFEDLATPEVEVFAEVGDDEVEGSEPVTSSMDDLAIASPEVSEPASESSDSNFDLSGAAVLGGLGVAGLGMFAAQSYAEESTSELPQAESLTSPAGDVAEVPSTISSLDELVFDDAPNPEAELTSEIAAEDAIFNANETPGLWASPDLDNFDLPQEESTDSLFDEPQVSEWASASSLETPSETLEADMGSWTFGDATPAEAEVPSLEIPEADMGSWAFGDATPAEAEAPSLEIPEADMGSWTFGDATPAEAEAPSLEIPEADMVSWTFGDATPATPELPESNLENISEAPTGEIASWNSEFSEASLENFSVTPDSDLGGWDLGDMSDGDMSDIDAEPTEIEMPKWDLADSSPAGAESPAPEDALASWQNNDLSLAAEPSNLELDLPGDSINGLDNELNFLGAETNTTPQWDALSDVLGSDNDLSGWEIESALPADNQIDSELDSLIESGDFEDFSLSTPEAWENWEDENVKDDPMAALDSLSNKTNPLELGDLDAEAGSWELPGEDDKLADPFANANLEGLNDWQLVVPEASQESGDRPADGLDLFLNSSESDKFPTDSQNPATPDPLSLDEELSLWGSEEDPFADIFSMESSESTEKQK